MMKCIRRVLPSVQVMYSWRRQPKTTRRRTYVAAQTPLLRRLVARGCRPLGGDTGRRFTRRATGAEGA